MFKNKIITSLFFILSGGIPLNLAAIDDHDAFNDSVHQRVASGREDIAYNHNYRQPYHEFRMGDWDAYQNWQYNREAYLRGESQPEYYRERYPFGPGRIGYNSIFDYPYYGPYYGPYSYGPYSYGPSYGPNYEPYSYYRPYYE